MVYEDYPLPGGSHARRVMLFHPELTPGRTAFFANLEDGWQTMVYSLAKKLGCECLRLTSSTESDGYPQNSFSLIQSGVPIRTLMAGKDDRGWEFFEDGDPLPIEDPSHYQRRRIRDRLNRDIIVGYANKLGWPIDEDDFWTSQESAVYFVERSDP
jgi:hypothetical protein